LSDTDIGVFLQTMTDGRDTGIAFRAGQEMRLCVYYSEPVTHDL